MAVVTTSPYNVYNTAAPLDSTSVNIDSYTMPVEKRIFEIWSDTKIDTSPVSGPTPVLSVSLGSNFEALGWRNDFYYRIHINIRTLDVGVVSVERTDALEFWNAYFEDVTLLSLNATEIDGIVLEGITYPKVFKALISESYVIRTLASGSTEIKAHFDFSWSIPEENFSLLVTGSRVVVLQEPFIDSITETLQWNTNVTTSYDGVTEQRTRLRVLPRRSFAGSLIAHPAQKARISNALSGWAGGGFIVPSWAEAQKFAHTVSAGATTITVDTTNTGYVAGAFIFLWNRLTNEAAKITAVTSTTVTLEKPLTKTIVAPWVMPAFIGFIPKQTQSYQLTIGYTDRIPVEFDLSTLLDVDEIAASSTQFLGYDVYFESPWLTMESVDEDITFKQETFDPGAGAVVRRAPWTDTKTIRVHRFVVQGLQQIWDFKRWLYRRAGKHKAFWQPSFKNDMRIIPDNTPIGQQIVIYDDDVSRLSARRIHLAIKPFNQDWIIRTVESMSKLSNGREQITVTELINYNASDIETISFLSLKRFNSDTIELQHGPNRTCICDIPLIEVMP